MKYRRLMGALIIGTASLLPLALLMLPAALLSASGVFEDSGQALGGDTSYDIDLADLDGDGDLDAFVANGLGNRVWINQGGAQSSQPAVFQQNGQNPGFFSSRGVALADLDGNETIDAVVANDKDNNNQVWLNNGSAQFNLAQEFTGVETDSRDLALSQLNNDPYPDLFIANNGANEVWLNNGDGSFSQAQSSLGDAASNRVVLGDVNNDGAIDAYVANGTTFALADELWINNGAGQFNASKQQLDLDWNAGAALGDLDGDNDLDIYLADWFQSDSVWINQGGAQGGAIGSFKNSDQTLSGGSSTDVALVDIDDDGDLDAVVAKFTGQPGEVWINDGQGRFSNTGQSLDDGATYRVAAGDLDNDGDADLFFANFGPNHVWLMSGAGQLRAWFDVAARRNPSGAAIYPWARQDDAALPVVLNFAAPQAVAVEAEITSKSGIEMRAIPFGAGQSTAQLVLTNPHPVFSETISIALSAEGDTAGTRLAASWLNATNRFNPLALQFINVREGPEDCLLCMMDWILKVGGFEPSFWQLHHLQLTELHTSPAWPYYLSLFQAGQPELLAIMLTNPALLWETFDVLQVWTPGIVAADNGQGDAVLVTNAQAAEAEALLLDLADAASPPLAKRIRSEIEVLDFSSIAGQTMDYALERVSERVQGQVYIPVAASSGR